MKSFLPILHVESGLTDFNKELLRQHVPVRWVPQYEGEWAEELDLHVKLGMCALKEDMHKNNFDEAIYKGSSFLGRM